MAETSTKDWLLENIELFLKKNPGLTEGGFGWFACADSSLITRLRMDKGITTDKMDSVIFFLKNPVSLNNPNREFKPITITKRIYE